MERITSLLRSKNLFTLGNLLTVTGILIALGIGIYTLKYQVTFGFDQARDAYEAINITKGDLKIIGPSTDIPGVYHGSLWFYLLSIPYGLFHDPQIVATIFFVITFLTVPLAGVVAYRLFKRRDVACISMLLYAFSPLFLSFTKWLSNPTYTLWVMPFFLLALWGYKNRQSFKSALLVGATMGIIIQSDFAFGLLLLLLPVYFVVFRLKIRLWDLAAFSTGLVILSLNYFFAELKFNGRMTLSMLHFISGSHNSHLSFIERLGVALKQITDLISVSLIKMDSGIVIAIFVGMILTLLYKRKKIDKKPFVFLVLWLCNIFLFLFFSTGISSSSFVFAPSLLIFIILISYIACLVFPKVILIPVIVVIVSLQAITSLGWMRIDFTPLSIQRGNTVHVEKEILDYTYTESAGRPFTVSIVNNPLYIHTTWAYLYEHLGKREYGYMPFLDGKNQAGYLGNLTPVKEKKGYVYLIIEPGPGIYAKFEQEGKDELDVFSRIIEERMIGNFLIQKREYNTDE